MRNSTGLVTFIIVGVIILFMAISTRNSIVASAEDVDNAAASVEAQLQRRNDLIPNLVATAQGYAKHEEVVFTQIAEARAQLAGAIESGNIDEISAADGYLSLNLSRLLAISENYPDLKANENFIALQDELAGTENRITYARNQYNEKVVVYNRKVKMFPTSFFAQLLGYKEREYFKAASGAENAPVVSFE